MKYTKIETHYYLGDIISQTAVTGTAIELGLDKDIVEFLETNIKYEFEDNLFVASTVTTIIKGFVENIDSI